MVEIAPPRGAALPGVSRRALAGVAGASLAASALFWSPLLLGGALAGRDWASHHWHYFDWLRTSLLEYGTLPLYMADAWITANFWANAESPVLGPLVPLLFALPTGAYLKLAIVLFTAAGLAGAFLLLRDLGASAPVAAPLAAVFAAGGFFVSHVSAGHPWALGGELLPGLLLLYRRAALDSGPALWGGAALGAAAILGGQHQPFVWQNGVLAGFGLLWALRVRSPFPLARLGLLWLATAGIAAVKLLPMALEFADYAPQARIPGLPVGLLAASLVGRGQGPELAPAGLAYAHGAGWWEYAFYVGAAPLVLLAAGLALARRVWPLAALGACLALLAVDWSRAGLDPWAALGSWPIGRTQRAPSRLLFPALALLLVAAAPGVERLYRAARRRWPRGALAASLALGFGIGADLFLESLPWQRAALGEPIASVDHRPRPLGIRSAGGARAELAAFAPNRLVYRVRAPGPQELLLPLRYGPWGLEWRLEPELPARDRRGRLAVRLEAGERELALRYRPAGLAPGAALSAAALAALAIGAWRRRRGAPA